MPIEIKHRDTGVVLFTADVDTLRGADLSYADLRGADLRGADLSRANLSYTNLSYANLSGADLCDANLSGADLSYANLSYADLIYADLSRANLSYANLSGADLSYANLSYADLSRANLTGADLRGAIVAAGRVISDANRFYHVSNIGSERGVLEMYLCDVWFVQRGCFSGTVEEFLAAVAKRHGDNEHAVKYRALIAALCN